MIRRTGPRAGALRAVTVVVLAVALSSLALAGCGGPEAPAVGTMRVGYVASEDCLPLWVVERDGLAKDAGVELKLTAFPNVEEREAALAGGTVDAVVGDVVAASKMRVAGTPVRIATIMLGATPAEGRYGIAVKPGSGVKSVVELAGKPVATSKGTLEEYVVESLMMLEGLGPAEIKKKTANDVAARYEALLSGELEAAVLPEPYVTLAEKRGAKVVAQDTDLLNLSQSVLVVSERYLDTSAGAAATAKLRELLGGAAASIDEDPSSFRALLVEKVPAMKAVAGTYQVARYPSPQSPTLEDVEMVLDWMTRAGLQKGDLAYEALLWTPPPPPEPEQE